MAEFDKIPGKTMPMSNAKDAPLLVASGQVPAQIASIEGKLSSTKSTSPSTPDRKTATATTSDASEPEQSTEVETSSNKETERKDKLLKLDALAASLYRSGNFKESSEHLKTALSIREEFLGPDDIDVLHNLNNLAASLGRLKKFDEAEALFRRVLNGREEKLGSEHMDTLATVNHLGVTIKQQRRLEEAEPYILRALAGFMKMESSLPTNGNGYILYAEAAYNYAVLCVQLGRRKKAAKYFGIAHQRLKQALGSDNPHTMDSSHWEIKCMKDADFVPKEGSSSETLPEQTSAEQQQPSDALVSETDTLTDHVSLLGIVYTKDADDDEVYQSRATWVNATNCELCSQLFTTITLIRPHHCRICARTVCDNCSKNFTVTKEFGLKTPVRCCDLCEQQGF